MPNTSQIQARARLEKIGVEAIGDASYFLRDWPPPGLFKLSGQDGHPMNRILYESGVTILGGKPKSGKSSFACTICSYALLQGISTCWVAGEGDFPSRQKIYMALKGIAPSEDARRLIGKQGLYAHVGRRVAGELLYFDDKENRYVLLDDLGIAGYKLLILDSFSTLTHIENENDNLSITRSFDPLHEWVENYHGSIFILDHISKEFSRHWSWSQEALRGGTAKAAAVNEIYLAKKSLLDANTPNPTPYVEMRLIESHFREPAFEKHIHLLLERGFSDFAPSDFQPSAKSDNNALIIEALIEEGDPKEGYWVAARDLGIELHQNTITKHLQQLIRLGSVQDNDRATTARRFRLADRSLYPSHDLPPNPDEQIDLIPF